MFAKKDAHTPSHGDTREPERELQLLYARRSAIEILIASLQNYQAQCQADSKQKLA
jgi:hypothetical protein